MRQLKLFSEKPAIEFGGSLLVGKRKSRRPLDTKATNALRLLRRRPIVEKTIREMSDRFDVRIYELGVQADHVHVAIRVPSREIYNRWIRALTSLLCQRVSDLKWRLRPYTKLGTWGRGFERLKSYIVHNRKGGEILECAVHAHARALFEVRRLTRGCRVVTVN